MNTAELSLEQAPPLAIPVSFFLVAPVALVGAGVLMALEAGALVGSRFHPAALAATHLITLGYLGAAMLGALYQMIPVVAGSPVPAPRLAHFVHICLVAGLGALVWGFLSGRPAAFAVALGALAGLLVAFVVPVGWALATAPARSDAVRGMQVAVLGLLGVLLVGLLLASGRSLERFRGDWTAWLATHALLGTVTWVGGLIGAVSWQVVPMFYLTDPPPRWARRLILSGVLSAIVAPFVALAAGASPRVVLLCVAPGAAAVWLLHPAATAYALHRRRRRRKDASQRFWWAGLALAPWVLASGVFAYAVPDPRLPVLFAWLALFGWAGLIVHGMLTRIVPFLVWFHRFSALVGLVEVPSMRKMLPDRRARLGLWVHLSALGLGAAAILGRSPLLAHLAGVALAATGLVLGSALLQVLRHKAPKGEGR